VFGCGVGEAREAREKDGVEHASLDGEERDTDISLGSHWLAGDGGDDASISSRWLPRRIL
jgi:hypothetical protein